VLGVGQLHPVGAHLLGQPEHVGDAIDVLQCSTTVTVSGQPSSLTTPMASILRWKDGVPAIRSDTAGSSAWMLGSGR
jgi:hypothetical protein